MSFPLPLSLLQPDPTLSLQEAFAADNRSGKINLSIGVIPNKDNAPFASIEKAMQIAAKNPYTVSPVPFTGSPQFTQAVASLLQLVDSPSIGLQTIGGTGALFLIGSFLKAHGIKSIALSVPTWPNHTHILDRIGLSSITWPHVNANDTYNEEQALKAIMEAPPDCGFLFQTSAHNPTGIDPSPNTWKAIISLLREKPHPLIFDMAALGLGHSFEQDMLPLRLALEQKVPCWIALSFATSLGLYSERIGALFYVGPQADLSAMKSNLVALARSTYSSPPQYGSQLCTTVLTDPECTTLWRHELEKIVAKMKATRLLFSKQLDGLISPTTQRVIANGNGLFCLLPLDERAITRLRNEWAIYVSQEGRINIAALDETMLPFVTQALDHVINEA